ncbi:MAG: energy transducer TonB [Bacteroidota bacterium]|nr:energy transducer TonB [Bacteroidota bacterium]
MKFLNTSHKKKSAIITFFSGLALLFLFFVFGLQYLDPPISYGMEVSFGISNEGDSDRKEQNSQYIDKDELIEKKLVQNESGLSNSTDVVVQEKSNVSINKKFQKKNKTLSNKEEIEKKKQNPEIESSTKNVLSNLVNQKEKKVKVNLLKEDDKGNNDANPYMNTYLDIKGIKDIENGYGLSGRNLKSNGKVIQECNEEGVVVVRIIVDPQGKVIEANPGVKGSTNIHPCLLKPAIETAFLHEWHPDEKAPSKQIGFVVINFKLRK